MIDQYLNPAQMEVNFIFDKECDRAFEDCTNIDAQIKGSITNIKNPISGRIEADEVGSVTYTEFAKAPKGACEITDKSK